MYSLLLIGGLGQFSYIGNKDSSSLYSFPPPTTKKFVEIEAKQQAKRLFGKMNSFDCNSHFFLWEVGWGGGGWGWGLSFHVGCNLWKFISLFVSLGDLLKQSMEGGR